VTSASQFLAPGHDAPAGLLRASFARPGTVCTHSMGHVERVSDSHSAFTLVKFSPAPGGLERCVRAKNVIGGQRYLQIVVRVSGKRGYTCTGSLLLRRGFQERDEAALIYALNVVAEQKAILIVIRVIFAKTTAGCSVGYPNLELPSRPRNLHHCYCLTQLRKQHDFSSVTLILLSSLYAPAFVLHKRSQALVR
jgi:hypothetical protein